LTAQLGGSPSFAARLLIRRTAKMMLRLEEFDRKLDEGRLTESDVKVIGGLQNATSTPPASTWRTGKSSCSPGIGT
jgi:hypothetical protein